MQTGDTIVAVGSAPGVSPRSLIRLSGPRTPDVLGALLSACPPARRAVAARARLDGGRELPVLVVRFEAPRSYTGEAAGEVQCPGNPVLVRRLVDRMLSACEGVREAEPGEFTARAYLAGRLSLDQAEGVAWTIAAATDAQLAAAADLLAGRAGARCERWAEEVATLLALVEAGIDFTDQEDVVPIRPADLVARLSDLRGQIGSHLGSAEGREAETDRPLVVLVGEPNAGKSTLFNALLGRERAVASDQRGTTRDALVEDLALDAEAPGHAPVRLADLPGLDADPRTPADAAAVGQAHEMIRRADLLVYCDPAGRFAPTVGGHELPASGAVVRVRTKADLPGSLIGAEAADAPGAVAVSAVDGRRLSVLRRAIADACIGSRAAAAGALMPRHARAMREAMEALDAAVAIVDAASEGPLEDPELVADALRTGLDRLGEVTGRIAPDEVLGRVFSTFCVGK